MAELLQTEDLPALETSCVSLDQPGPQRSHARSVHYADDLPFAPTPENHGLEMIPEEQLRSQIRVLAENIKTQLQQATLTATLAKRQHNKAAVSGGGEESPAPTSHNATTAHGKTMCDTRRMRDGLLAMTTEARHDDFRTILRKREIRLAEALQQKVSLEAKLSVVKATMGDICAHQTDLDALRHNHRLDVAHHRRDIKAIQQDIIALGWEETSLHNQIQDLMNSLQDMRKKKLPSQLQLLDGLNQDNKELSHLEGLVAKERDEYDHAYRSKRRHLRHLAQEIARIEAKIHAREHAPHPARSDGNGSDVWGSKHGGIFAWTGTPDAAFFEEGGSYATGTKKAFCLGLPPSANRLQELKSPTITEDSRNLLLKLLQLDPKDRPTADEALGYPWFKSMWPYIKEQKALCDASAKVPEGARDKWDDFWTDIETATKEAPEWSDAVEAELVQALTQSAAAASSAEAS